jgi:predicted methyltransferase
MRIYLTKRNRILTALLGSLLTVSCATTENRPSGATPDYASIVRSPDRSAADREADARRLPEQLLAFAGVKPGMRVLDIGAGGGYSTELLARAVGPQGKVYAQNARQRDALDERLQTPAMKNVTAVIRPFDDPAPPEAKNLDLIAMFFVYHDTTFQPVDRAKMNKAFFEALKPGGYLVITDHSAKAGDGATVGKSLHRIEEATLRQEVETAGFKLAAQSDFLRNPADPRDAPFFNMNTVTDQFALKFVKP